MVFQGRERVGCRCRPWRGASGDCGIEARLDADGSRLATMDQPGISESPSSFGRWFDRPEVLREIFATSTHSLVLRGSVVVRLEDAFAQIAPIIDDLAGSSGISMGRDRAGRNGMR
ncbi:hypothetical protein ACFQE8_02855 [Salinirubellus sp. GCM10025818]|uniref:hypothetical protein n=1 Tax=Salinirubellus TaxID=2162630 RepID=UPI0030CAA875